MGIGLAPHILIQAAKGLTANFHNFKTGMGTLDGPVLLLEKSPRITNLNKSKLVFVKHCVSVMQCCVRRVKQLYSTAAMYDKRSEVLVSELADIKNRKCFYSGKILVPDG